MLEISVDEQESKKALKTASRLHHLLGIYLTGCSKRYGIVYAEKVETGLRDLMEIPMVSSSVRESEESGGD